MSRRKDILTLAVGILIGATLVPAASAAADYVQARLSDQPVYLDGARLDCRTYRIADQNYIRLVDLCDALGVAWCWDSSTNSVYLGERPEPEAKPTASGTVTLPADGSRYVPRAGDRVLCDDGTLYEITDTARWTDVGPLPAGTPVSPLPAPEARHFSDPAHGRDTLWVRNLHETRRMELTLRSVLGGEAEISLTIPAEYESITGTFWPWRASEVEKHARNVPAAHFYVEAWDYYRNGAFQYTRYCIVTL